VVAHAHAPHYHGDFRRSGLRCALTDRIAARGDRSRARSSRSKQHIAFSTKNSRSSSARLTGTRRTCQLICDEIDAFSLGGDLSLSVFRTASRRTHARLLSPQVAIEPAEDRVRAPFGGSFCERSRSTSGGPTSSTGRRLVLRTAGVSVTSRVSAATTIGALLGPEPGLAHARTHAAPRHLRTVGPNRPRPIARPRRCRGSPDRSSSRRERAGSRRQSRAGPRTVRSERFAISRDAPSLPWRRATDPRAARSSRALHPEVPHRARTCEPVPSRPPYMRAGRPSPFRASLEVGTRTLAPRGAPWFSRPFVFAAGEGPVLVASPARDRER
jgi:hypothetical protein